MKVLYVVNASRLLADAEVLATVVPLQTQIDRDFVPVWKSKLAEPEIEVRFAGIGDIPNLEPGSWPIFLNRHSADSGALGWHDDDPEQKIQIYSRVYVGDCMLLGLSWQTTLSHEALELILNPDVKRVYKMGDGRLVAYEACDAVEADEQAYDIQGFKASNFVTPAYFSSGDPGPFDFMKKLTARVPSLTKGGYLSVTSANGNWAQISLDRSRGLLGRRAATIGHRRQMIAKVIEGFELEE
jgi:hypothetical protein